MRDKIRLAWVQILRALYGESWKNDPNLIDSPDRIANSIVNERCSGINSEVECREILNSTFLSEYDGMVIISPIIVSSLCPHHFENINYLIHFGYIPKGNVVGLSKPIKVMRLMAQQPILQEDYTKKLADLFWDALQPEGLGIIVKGQHSCMTARGLHQLGGINTITSEVRGWFRDNGYIKDEFLKLCKI